MSVINSKTNAFYNWIAPDISQDANKKVEVVFPTQEEINVVLDSENNDIEVTVKRSFTVANVSISADGNLTFAATEDIKIGDKVLAAIEVGDSDVTVDLNFAGLIVSSISLPAGTTANIFLIYNGTVFLPFVSGSLTPAEPAEPAEHSFDRIAPDYAALLDIATKTRRTIVQPTELTGDIVINTSNDDAIEGDLMHLILKADAIGDREFTPSIGFHEDSLETLTIPTGESISIGYVYTINGWVRIY